MRDLTAVPKTWMGTVTTIRRGYVRRAPDGSYTDLSGSGTAPGERVAAMIREGWAGLRSGTDEVELTVYGDAAVTLTEQRIGDLPMSVQRALVLIDRETVPADGGGRLDARVITAVTGRRLVTRSGGCLRLTGSGRTALTALRTTWGVRA
ncbi:hypothetical protein [Micromonospora sp. WMMC273]|uniref:hypothetical protein n=1 Tax=Micromonospora sp. WMMC273 TaxID=3015157 RepID=UPI0022B75203|nr:hypothetical protein [Micromonospora sp. WMMC273]MCZ7478845.1 hypothetical protein [Micromonospora sp. WMMC273]